jgi:hypothetical protein
MTSQDKNSQQAFNPTQANATKKKKLQPPPDIKKPKKTE